MPLPSRRAPTSREERPIELVLPSRAIVALLVAGLGTIVAARMVDALGEVIYVVALAVALACLLAPGVERLARRMPRGVAVALLFLTCFGMLVALVAGGTRDLTDAADAATKVLSHRFDTLDPGSLLGRFVHQSQISERTTGFVNRLPSQLVFGVDQAADAPRRVGQVVVVSVLTLFALGSGPKIARAGLARVSDSRRRRVIGDLLRRAIRDSAAFVNRSLAMGAVCGLATGVAAYLLGATGAVALGVWSGLWAVVPVLGPVVGVAPLVLLAGAHDPWRGAVAVGLAVVLALGVRTVRHAWVDRDAHLGPLLTVLAVATGIRLAGPVACVPVLFFTGVVASAIRTIGRAGGFAGPAAALDEFVQGTADRTEEEPSARPAMWRTSRANNVGQLAVTISWRSIGLLMVLIVLVVAALTLFHRVPSVAIWTVLGVALGLALNPAVNQVDRWLPGGRSATLAVLGTGAAMLVGALLVAAVPSLVDAVRSLPQEVPDTVDRIARLPLIDRFLDAGRSRDAAQHFIDELPERFSARGSPLSTVAAQAGDTLFGTLWTLLIAVTALLDGHRLLAAARRALPPSSRPPAERLADLAYRSFGRYAAGSALVALINGSVVTAIALALGIPVAPLLGLWAMLWNFVPQVGGLIGGAPLVLLGFTRSPLSGIVALLLFIAYQNIENHVIQPVVIGKAVRLSPFSIMICVLSGGAVGGVIGAVLATPLVGAVKVILCDVLPQPAAGGAEQPEPSDGQSEEPTVGRSEEPTVGRSEEQRRTPSTSERPAASAGHGEHGPQPAGPAPGAVPAADPDAPTGPLALPQPGPGPANDAARAWWHKPRRSGTPARS